MLSCWLMTVPRSPCAFHEAFLLLSVRRRYICLCMYVRMYVCMYVTMSIGCERRACGWALQSNLYFKRNKDPLEPLGTRTRDTTSEKLPTWQSEQKWHQCYWKWYLQPTYPTSSFTRALPFSSHSCCLPGSLDIKTRLISFSGRCLLLLWWHDVEWRVKFVRSSALRKRDKKMVARKEHIIVAKVRNLLSFAPCWFVSFASFVFVDTCNWYVCVWDVTWLIE
jgi:hypothetical protein